ncbi:MAG: dihydrolipoyl dehydrogenase [Nanoarchaeota archaeon]
MKVFDLIVIGSGSGLDLAVSASEKGLKTAIIEKGPLGGTCLNRGCIPSKMLIHSADLISQIKKSHLFGIKTKITKIDFKKIVSRVVKTVDQESREIENSLKHSKNPVLFKGPCKFIDFKTIKVNNEILKAEKILLAVGSRPIIPNIKGLNKVNYMTSAEALRLKKFPKTMTIIGGGYIAAELAHFYGSLGAKINIVQHNKLILPREDIDISNKITELFKKRYNVFTEYEAEEVKKKGEKFILKIKHNEKNISKTLKSDQLLIAIGVTPNSDLLNLEKTKVKTDEKGFIKANEFLETNIPGIYALGDCIGKFLFKHSANLEAEYVYSNLVLNKKEKVDYFAMPHAVFTNPQIASVGFTEQELKEKKIPYSVSKYSYIDTGMGHAIEEKDGFVKILVDKQGKILGCHILGHEASTLIHEVIVAMKSGNGNIKNIINSVHIHPALSEVVQRAANNLF